jgi:energy-coupling factor transporter transmembrane protein EcfT
MRQLKISKGDYAASFIFIVYFAAVIVLKIW